MIIIQQTTKPTESGAAQAVNISDAAGNALSSTLGALNVNTNGGTTNSAYDVSPNFNGSAWTHLVAGVCKNVVIANYTGLTIWVSKNAGVSYIPMLNNSTLCVDFITNTNQVYLRRSDASAVNVNANLIIYT